MAFPLAEEQDKFLKEASQSVKKNAYFMRKAMVGAADINSRGCVISMTA